VNGLPTGSEQLPIVMSLEARVRNSSMGYMVWEGERIASKVTQMLKPSNDELEFNNGLHGAIQTDATTASIHRRLFRYVDTHIPESEAKVVKGEVLELIQRIEDARCNVVRVEREIEEERRVLKRQREGQALTLQLEREKHKNEVEALLRERHIAVSQAMSTAAEIERVDFHTHLLRGKNRTLDAAS
jgi:hypothetical protein